MFTNLTSFMPAQTDLEDIKLFFQESASIPSADAPESRTAMTSLNILLETPLNYCENRQPSFSESTTISLLSPQE